MNSKLLLCGGLMAVSLQVLAAEPVPERQRPVGAAQAVGVVHTLRQIPEACARLEGVFTGQPTEPYRFSVVQISATCQPRAQFVDYAKAAPSEAGGWKLNDIIRVPNASCAGQQATVKVWRKPANNQPPKLDGQGQSRIYLEEAKKQAASGQMAQVAKFAAQMQVEGKTCR